MRTLIYYMRVLLVSLEALVVLVFVALSTVYSNMAADISQSLSLGEDLKKYVMFAPIALGVWSLLEVRNLAMQAPKQTKLLLEWPDYWRLEAHMFAAKLYLFSFAALSLVPAFRAAGMSDGLGFSAFSCSLVGQVLVAYSVYSARQGIHQILSRAE